MSANNNVTIIGRLTADPELKQTNSGLNTCRINVAVNRSFSKDKEQTADFITVTAWRQTADFICKYFSKGKMIAIQGEIRTGNYTDNNGNKHYTFEVLADNVSFCGDRQQNNISNTDNQSKQQNTTKVNTNIGDIGLEGFEDVITKEQLPF